MRLERSETLVVLIDLQEKLMPVIDRGAEVARNAERLIRGCKVLDVPLLLTEQYVKGLGPTIEPLRRALEETSGYVPVEKACFSSYGAAEFETALRVARRRQIVVAGIEAHVCVYQTVTDLLGAGYEVSIVADAISSRAPENRDTALRRMTADGARLTSTEMCLFEMLATSGTEEFRAISRLVK
ncbi:MAG: isochorismatase hydrolase [Acidobacteria bacterium]|nr:isochorismatase hydrolase [Acidobacteriota bacterium]